MASSPPAKKGEEDIGILTKIENLAAAQYRNGNFLEAIDLLRKALLLRENSSAEKDDLDTLSVMSNLAAALGRAKSFNESEMKFRYVLAARESKLGNDHVETLITANYLGVIIKQQKRLKEAEKLVYRAVLGFESLKTKGCHSSVIFAEAAYNYAIICVQLGNRKKAGRYFRMARQGLEKELGVENPHTLDALDWEIRCTSETGLRDESAEHSTTDAGTTRETVLNSDNSLQTNSSDVKVSIIDDDEGSVIGVDDNEAYLTRGSWHNTKNCELCNKAFKVTSMISFLFLSYS